VSFTIFSEICNFIIKSPSCYEMLILKEGVALLGDMAEVKGWALSIGRKNLLNLRQHPLLIIL
jgi:hypothetical protein